MIRYLGELITKENVLLFLAEEIPEEYSKVLEIKVDQYHEKTSYTYIPYEAALMTVELDTSKRDLSLENIAIEAREFVKWYNTVINEVIIR